MVSPTYTERQARPPAGKPQPLNLPLLPCWAMRRNVTFHCARVGCRCQFTALELAPRQEWAGDKRWFAPCGHCQEGTGCPRPRPVEVTL